MGKIYMHIGTGKTGSSAIQAFLSLNYKLLKKNGILFPSPPNIEKQQPFQTTSGNGTEILKLMQLNLIDELEEKIKQYSKMKLDVLISSENIINLIPICFDDIIRLAKKYNIIFIVYVRRPDEFLLSEYNQKVKNHGESENLLIREDMHPIYGALYKMVKQFDKENLIIKPYEKQQFKGGNIYSDFLEAIGLEFTDKYKLPNKVVNPSLSLDAMEYKKTINSIEGYGEVNLNADRVLINSYILDYVVNEKKEGKAFQSTDIIGKEKREEILKNYDSLNKAIATKFLDREDGKLFFNEVSDNYNQSNYVTTIDDYLKISKYMLNKFDLSNLEMNMSDLEKEIKFIIAKFTVDKMLNKTNPIEKDVTNKFKQVFELAAAPSLVSEFFAIRKYENNKLYFKSTGNDPYFILPLLEKNESKELTIKISIETTIKSFIEVFYASASQKFNRDRVVKFDINKENNIYILNIKNNEAIKRVRFDIGNQIGEYIINSIEIYYQNN